MKAPFINPKPYLISSDGFWRFGLGLHFRESRSRRLQVSITAFCLETLNFAKKWLSKTSIIPTVFCLLYLQVLSPFCYELMWEALGQLKNTETGVTRGRIVQFV